nr:RNA-directed DNA polymerase, eukaryota [Tanacetum cinerariifolium]
MVVLEFLVTMLLIELFSLNGFDDFLSWFLSMDEIHKSYYGEYGALNSSSYLSKRSPWLDIIFVKKINQASMVDTFRRPPRGGAEKEQLDFLLSRIDGLILINIPDRWVWSLEATCEFSLKLIRQVICDSILSKEEVTTRWVKVMPIKINVFAWRVRLDKLRTRKRMRWWELEDIDLASYDD